MDVVMNDSHVSFQAIFIPECFVTLLTFERFIGMDTFPMPFEISRLGERIVTQLTFVFSFFFVNSVHVVNKWLSWGQLFVTQLAFQRQSQMLGIRMVFELGGSLIAGITFVALEWFVTFMSGCYVKVERLFAGKGFVTLGAGPGFLLFNFVRMFPQGMILNLLPMVESGFTVEALKLSVFVVVNVRHVLFQTFLRHAEGRTDSAPT